MSPSIRTPDQHLRVFVSSTLRELAPERVAARGAIERLHLAPVMFELGARPHPPRELYRSYLAQSDVFVGIYGESYGWVAPGESVSGLEDEYNLAPAAMPKLIYVKSTAARDERLSELILRIQTDDTAAYLHFDSAEELADRVFADLATLLAERFDLTRPAPAPPPPPAPAPESPSGSSSTPRLPVPYTTTIGRDDDIARVLGLLRDGRHHLVSLIGPGGVGKSRLAIEVGHAARELFDDGVYFVALEGVLEPKLLLTTIAYVLGIRDAGETALEERVARSLADRDVLLILDNFEQIVDAAPVLVRLSTAAPRARFLVTSRTLLRVRGEQVCDVAALTTPGGEGWTGVERASAATAVQLFVDRAAAAKPGFALTEENASDVVAICRALEGLPLAIELAAALTRLLTPHDIAQRLTRSLPLLTAAARDVPERHRTIRATIEWSVSLLSPTHRAMLEDLGVFAREFSLEAVEALGRGRVWEGEALDGIAALIDGSLVKQADIAGRPVLALLALVREYAVGELRERGEIDEMRRAHADYYLSLVRTHAPKLRGQGQIDAVTALGRDLPNLRAAARHLVHTGRLDDAGSFAWSMLIYWWIRGFFAEVRVWMLELLEKEQPIEQHTRAVAWFFTLWGELWQHPSDQVIAGLGECVRLFREAGDEDAAAMALAARATARVQLPDPDIPTAEAELAEASARLHEFGNGWAEAITEVSRGRVAWLTGRADDARTHFHAALRIAEAGGDVFTQSLAGNQLARLNFVQGDIPAAEEGFIRTMLLSVGLHHDEGVAYGLEGLCAVAASRGDAWRAGVLCGAAATIRHRVGYFDIAAFTVHAAALDRLREADDATIRDGEHHGWDMTVAEALAFALPTSDEATVHDQLETW